MHPHHGCGSGPGDPRDPEDTTPRISRRAACGIALGGLASVAAGAFGPLGALAAQASPSERRDAEDEYGQALADSRLHAGAFADDDRSPHVVVIGIDGLRPDALQTATTPTFDWQVANGTACFRAFAGGNPVVNEQVTSSGPGWSSICTGVWVDGHGVESNAFLTPNYATYPHFFQRILEQEPDTSLASVVSWEPVNDIILKGMDSKYADQILQSRPWTIFTDVESDRQRDTEVAQITAALIATKAPTVTFVHLDACDGAGHATAFAPDSPEYIRSIENSDAAFATIRKAVEARPTRNKERWSYIVTTDHGGLNNGHGGQTVEERKIPFLFGGDDLPVGEEIHGPGHLAVPPTTLAYLGIPVLEKWGWKSGPFAIPAA